MFSGMLRKAALVAAGSTLALVAGTAPAGASTPTAGTALRGGTTTVTTGPGIAATLLRNGILPVATPPGRQGIRFDQGGLAVTYSFPVTGGRVNLDTLAGTIAHRGGITFVNLRNGKRIGVSDFVIDTAAGTLTARVNGTATRVPVFDLDLTAATVHAQGRTVRVGNIDVKVTAVAASALNAALGTTLFAGGLDLGTAKTTLRV